MSFIFLGFISNNVQEDIEENKNHPMIFRYEGFYICGYEHYDYDRLTFYTGEKDGRASNQRVELVKIVVQ